jgi:hypothetical protein
MGGLGNQSNAGTMRDLGFTNIGNNAKAPPGARGTVGSGINKTSAPGSLTQDAETTNDTHLMPLGEGTVESGGING